jgi:hypothetical protein
LKAKELAFFRAENELVFTCKKGQTNSKKRPKNHTLRGIELEKRLKYVFGSPWEDSRDQ